MTDTEKKLRTLLMEIANCGMIDWGNPKYVTIQVPRELLREIATEGSLTDPELHHFTCPECGGHHFGSVIDHRPDGSIWKTHEECHDQHRTGCTWRKEKLICIVKANK